MRQFDFQGNCEYIMAQSCGSNDFVISTVNVPCGASGAVACAEGVRISLQNSKPSEIYIA